ncbi:MAG TPA: 2Fe-2S iron-sulfur cluster-binding protein [Trebonia sp.]|jgi:fumarate reductase (CoM/CoB) subunit B|nr:2Fe-2S iron-sulfur cluster-binding protein [Trebonia sp.]
MADTMTAHVRIFRSDPSSGEPDRYDEFEVTGAATMRVLDVLRSVYEHDCHDLAFQYACRIGRCGTCGVQVNGKPVLACQERAIAEMTVEPLSPFPVVRDLVIDRTEVEEHYVELDLAPQRSAPHAGVIDPVEPERGRAISILGSCIGCMICVSACPAVQDRPFDGPAFMLQLRRLADLPADQGPRLEQAIEHGMLECFGCDACTQLCPADLSPADAIRGFRSEVLLGRRRGGRRKENSNGN